MKKVLAFVLVVFMLAAISPFAFAASATVNVSISVDGKLLVAAQPVSVTDLTVNGVLKAAHKAYYSGGESGYVADIDPTWNMFLITKCWGVSATPYVIINGYPLGSPEVPDTADKAAVKAGDNIIVSTSSDPAVPAQAIALTATVADGAATVKATSWVLDFTTFTYKSSPLASAKIVDPVTGTALGTTDANGSITVTVPESGIVAVDGLAAINLAGGAGNAQPLPQTGGFSASAIVGIAGLALLAAGATTFVVGKKRAGRSA